MHVTNQGFTPARSDNDSISTLFFNPCKMSCHGDLWVCAGGATMRNKSTKKNGRYFISDSIPIRQFLPTFAEWQGDSPKQATGEIIFSK